MPPTTRSTEYGYLAPLYASLARLYSGGAIPACQRWAVEQIAPSTRALFVGSGPGSDVALAARRGVHVIAVDHCAAMLGQTRQRLSRQGLMHDVQLQHADVLLQPPAQQYDVVVAQFFCNVFAPHQLPGVLRRLGESLRPQGRLLLGDFALPSGFWQTAYHDVPMHLFARLGVNTVHPPHDLPTQLQRAGFAVTERRRFRLFRCGPAWIEGLVAQRRPA